MIEVKDLTKRFGNNLALDHLSFTAESGKIYGLLGPNGAGKSTTMNIMTGYLAATDGSVSIDGHDILDDPEEARKCIGFLPEFPPLYMDMTVQEYLMFAARLKKIPRRSLKEAVDEAMEVARVQEMRHRLIRNLSKGFQQRTGLAQAVLGFPDILILDEPTVGLDPLQIIEIRDTIQSLGSSHTIILSSHILSEVKTICDHILILSKGRLVASDSTEQLIQSSREKNILELTVRGDRARVESVLRQDSKCLNLSIRRSSEENCVDVSMEFSQGCDEREKIFYGLSQARLPIYRMTQAGRSLEDVFRELTAEQEEE